jgi:hypothetical protein
VNYPSGEEVKLGDRVKIGSWSVGTVVCSIDTDEYSPDYPREEWGYLSRGVIILTEGAGLIHYDEADQDMELVARQAARSS